MGERVSTETVEREPSFAEDYWRGLTDEQLLTVVWSIPDPRKLPNLRTNIPADLGEFQIESEYHLNAAEEPVRCGHCPGHTRHWHGYVLLDKRGDRYLLGSRCGPLAYGADYRAASKARRDAERRAEQLRRWSKLEADLPSVILRLSIFHKSPIFTVVRRARRQIDAHVPSIAARIRALRPHPATGKIDLSRITHERDHAAEQRNETAFRLAISELPVLANKAHNKAIAELREKYAVGREIIVTTDHKLGALEGSAWLIANNDPMQAFEDGIARLRALVAIASNTANMTTLKLERHVRAAQQELETALRLEVEVRGAACFFSAANLDRLSLWYAGDPARRGSITIDDDALRFVSAGGETVTIRLPVP